MNSLKPKIQNLCLFKLHQLKNFVRNNSDNVDDHVALQCVIRSFQARGHLLAKTDPLGINVKAPNGAPPSELLLNYQMKNRLKDMNKVYRIPDNTFIGGDKKELPLGDIINRLKESYCKHIGVEFMHIDSLKERYFIRQRMETPGATTIPPEIRQRTLKRLTRSAELETYFMKKWPSEKRFGVEGEDMLIPMIKQIVDKSSELGVEHIIIGMPHRGRMNVLANVCRKPLSQVFTQFEAVEPGDVGSGDVKYHWGSQTERLNRATGKNIKITLLPNPSHLEVVTPVVIGRARAEQFYAGDKEGKKVLAIVMHGDASFCGQGIVYESFNMSALPCFTTHGSITIIVNNQVGFTTDPRYSRSSPYCSDLGKVINAPIFHVNADEPDSVVHVANLSAEWRAKYGKDVVIDLIGYRKHGHSEADEPMFTQPIMYTKIKTMKPVLQKYTEQLINEKVATQEDVKQYQEKYLKICEDEHAKAVKQTQVFFKDWLDAPWPGFLENKEPFKVRPTGQPEAVVAEICKKFSSPPPDQNFIIHPLLNRILKNRATLAEKRLMDWSMGEAVAFGTLVKEGVHVRITGEDSERGPFGHRHHVMHHQTKDKVMYNPLTAIFPKQAEYEICNSALCEYAMLGYELGYSQTNPNSLTIWECQFGDFSNVAQCVIDQFVSSGQAKWIRQNGLVIYLPHGYEGQGPEHSSARPERYLQMCDDDPHVIPPMGPQFAIKQLHECNWIVANCSTPANLFHILRRQVALAFRKPLILFTHKGTTLKSPECISSFDDIKEGTEFRRVIPEEGEASKNPKDVKQVLFCTGRAFYHIRKARADAKLEKAIAIVRIEQLSPFPYDLLQIECEKYPTAKLKWAQEEPKNQGFYLYVLERMRTLLKNTREVGYVGRTVMAAPATGSKTQYKHEVATLMKDFVTI